MSHLYCQCQKHKCFGFSNVRLRSGSIVKSVYIITVVAVRLHDKQSDNFCKIQKKNAKWTGAIIYVGRFIVLLSSGAPCIRVCYTALRARGACPLQGYWLLSLFTWPILTSILFIRGTGWNWTAGLVTTGCLAVRLRLWLSEPPSTELTSLDTLALSLSVSKISSDISLGCSNLGLLHGWVIIPPLTPTVKWLLGRKTSSLSNWI